MCFSRFNENLFFNQHMGAKKTELTVFQKQEICRYALDHPSCKQRELVRLFSQKFGCKISNSVVCNMLSHSNEILAKNENESKKFRNRLAKYPQLEESLYAWFCETRSLQIPVTDAMLTEKAIQFGTMLEISNFTYSAGWLDKFKKRHYIRKKVLNGEVGLVDQVFFFR